MLTLKRVASGVADSRELFELARAEHEPPTIAVLRLGVLGDYMLLTVNVAAGRIAASIEQLSNALPCQRH